jgi:hypothetical protein
MKAEDHSNRRLSVAYFRKSSEGFFVAGEEGSKGGREDAQHQVNLAGTMNIIPSRWHTHLPIAPQDQNS